MREDGWLLEPSPCSIEDRAARSVQYRAHIQNTAHLETPISLNMPLGCGWKLKDSEETNVTWGEHANSKHTESMQDSVLQPWSYDAMVLRIMPPPNFRSLKHNRKHNKCGFHTLTGRHS